MTPPQTPFVAVVNETFARKMWGETPALGQHFIVSGHLTEVVGVAEDGKYHDLQEPPQPVVYLPLSQNERANTDLRGAIAADRRTNSPRRSNAP